MHDMKKNKSELVRELKELREKLAELEEIREPSPVGGGREASGEDEGLLRAITENYPDSYPSIIESDMTVGYTAGREFSRQGIDPGRFVGMTLEGTFTYVSPSAWTSPRSRYLKKP